MALRWREQPELADIKKSCAFGYNTLSGNSKRLCWHTTKEVVTMSTNLVDQRSIEARDGAVFQTKLIRSDAIAIATQTGVQVVNTDCTSTLGFFALPTTRRNGQPPSMEPFTRGLVFIEPNVLVVGTSSGDLLIFSYNQNLQLLQTMDEVHRAPVACIAASGSYLASTDDEGVIQVWVLPAFRRSVTISQYAGSPCTSACFCGSTLIAGWASGHVRMFDAATGAPIAEICAHARAVTALAAHPRRNLFASVSEDTCLLVFTVPNGPDDKIIHLFSAIVPSCLLCGVSFCGKDDDDIAVCGYDQYSISVFRHV